MKAIILSIIFLLLLASSCEEVIYKDRILLTPVYIRSFRSVTLDSVRTIATQTDTVYHPVVTQQIDTVYLDGEIVIDTVEIINYVPVIDTIYVDVVRIDTVERQSQIACPSVLQNYVDYFIEKRSPYGMLNVDVEIRLEDLPRHTDSYGLVDDGGILIRIRMDGCYEGAVYRELSHFLFTYPYQERFNDLFPDENDFIMSDNWTKCLEDMNESDRNKYMSAIGL